jgi:DNA-binding NarL/FixJ family response regulator
MKLLIIENDRILLESMCLSLPLLANELNTTPEEIEVLSTSEGILGISLAKQNNPDVILLDMKLEDIDGISMIKELKPFCQNIIAVTGFPAEYAKRAKEAGVSGIITKGSSSLKTLCSAIIQVSSGKSYFSDGLINPPELTPREYEILCLIMAQWISNVDIGVKLTISPHTVRNHITNICQKLQVKNRTQAVFRAKELGLLR